MTLKIIRPNMTELDLGEKGKILFSYETPVAHQFLTPEGRVYYRTEVRYSNTTQRHINSWLPTNLAETRPQSYFDEVVK